MSLIFDLPLAVLLHAMVGLYIVHRYRHRPCQRMKDEWWRVYLVDCIDITQPGGVQLQHEWQEGG